MHDALGDPESRHVERTRLLLDKIIRSIVSDSDAVRVEAAPTPDAVVFLVRVAELDAAKVIGEDGRTARALRTIVGAAGSRHRQRFVLDLEDCSPAPSRI